MFRFVGILILAIISTLALGFSSQNYSTGTNNAVWFDMYFVASLPTNTPESNIPRSETFSGTGADKIIPFLGTADFSEFADTIETGGVRNSGGVIGSGENKTPNIENEKANWRPPSSGTGDTSKISDTLMTAADSLRARPEAKDSSARLRYYSYKPFEFPTISLFPKKETKFRAQNSLQLRKRVIEIDSSGKFVSIKEMVGQIIVRGPFLIPIDDYLKMKIQSKEDEIWADLAYKYELKEGKKDLGNLIKDITDFEIPLPSVGVLSIFGAPKISLRIGGAVDIHGAWKNETTEGITASRLGNTRNEPDFRQQVQINVNGTIGDKLQINADWNTERTFEYENQLKIKYTGYEDEIVQNVEAGNVSLQTAPLVGGSEALFGVKADFKLGPLTLTALASQKKGEVKEKSVTGGAQSQEFTLHAYDYSKNHYFLDSIYTDTSAALNMFYKYYGNPSPIIIDQYRVKDIEVWRSIYQATKDPNERNGIAYVNLDPLIGTLRYNDDLRADSVTDVSGRVVRGRFIRLTPDKDYTLQDKTGFITFKTSIQETDIIAVSYRTENTTQSPDDDLFYGEFTTQSSDTSKRIILKLIKPQNLQPTYTEAWRLQLKNIYPVGGRNIKKEGFVFDIKFLTGGSDLTNAPNTLGGVRLLNAFGLDLTGPNDAGGPDGTFDFKTGQNIFPETGEIIFPVLQPFGLNIPGNIPDRDTIRYTEVYTKPVSEAKYATTKDKFILTGKFSGDASSTYQLGFNVVENSVRVLLNGRELSPGVDYFVDYSLGQLTLRNEAAMNPGANLKITYEENDLFQIASKTLFGVRGIIDLGKQTTLGFSALTLSQQTLSDKVRIGEEPLSNSIYGLDFSTEGDLPFLTKAADYLFSTKTMSKFTLRGEIAHMRPDPNTKKSTIASDNGESIAYIDDFEGTKQIIPVGIGYTTWKDLSAPDSINSALNNTPFKERIKNKAKSFWFNVTPSIVQAKSIWPKKRVARGDEAVTVLDYVYLPDTKGSYNSTEVSVRRRDNWGGMMKLLSSTANNLVEQNMEFIEFWANIQSAEAGAKINLDLGQITEDVIPDDALNTEDRIRQNEVIDDGEDLGLDGLDDNGERASLTSTTADPNNDNFGYRLTGIYVPQDYLSINGTQGNATLTDAGKIPDTEDLNRNGTLDRLNSYYRYTIPLDTNRSSNPYIVGGGDNDSWYQYRIPLKDFAKAIGSPTFKIVEAIRFFITDTDSSVHIRITEFNLVGNQWRRNIPNDSLLTTSDSSLSLSVVNIEDNPEYRSPDGVQRERDRSRPDQEIFRNEQSLNMIFRELPKGESREAIKILFRPLDAFNYKSMKIFIHGPEFTGGNSISNYESSTSYAADFYFKFGIDSNNYYAYKRPVQANWQEITVNFSELTAIKSARDTGNAEFEIPVPGQPGHFFIIKGSPSLTQIKFLSMGIYNRVNGTPVAGGISGDIWVNELRVIGADNQSGTAYSVSANLQIADLMTLSFNLSQQDPYFHRLSERFGSRNDSKNWGVSADVDVLRFLPFDMPGSNLKLNYSHTESMGRPLYLPSTDIKVDQAKTRLQQRLEAQGYSRETAEKLAEKLVIESENFNQSDSWTLGGIKLKVPTDFWLIRETINNLSMSFSYNNSVSRSPNIELNRSWVWNGGVSYSLNLPQDWSFYPADIPVLGIPVALLSDYRNTKIFYSPQTFSYDIGARRSRTTNMTREDPTGRSAQVFTDSRDFGTSRKMVLGWKLTENAALNISLNYNYEIMSTLGYLDSARFKRSEWDVWKDILGGAFFGKDFQFRQGLDIRTAPKLPALWDINKFLTLTYGYAVQYQWDNDQRQVELGRRAGYSAANTVAMTLRLKSLLEPLFGSNSNSGNSQFNVDDQIRRDQTQPGDSTVTDSVTAPKTPVYERVLNILKITGRALLVDYENISINFSNNNSFSASGLRGEGSGLGNFFGIKYSYSKGTPRMFMMGLSNDPGPRAPNGNLSNSFNTRNNIDLRTSRELWEGARIDISWNVGWSLTKSQNITTDALGDLIPGQVSATGTIDRSFLSIPPFLIFSVFKSGIKRVNELYNPRAANPSQNLSEAFVQGFETLPLLSSISFLKDLTNYIPRPNWRISWDGLEKLPLFKSFTQRVSLDHSYNSKYSEGWKLDPGGSGKQLVQTQRISFDFQPLIGLNLTLNSIWDGNFSGSVKYNTRSNFDYTPGTTANITEGFSREIGITLNFAKSGFELPLFGISLKNDVDMSVTYSNTKGSTIIFDMNKFNEKGTPQDGSTRTTLEPRVKYVISSRVSLSIFYRRSTVAPEGANKITPSTTNEAGVDVRISIN